MKENQRQNYDLRSNGNSILHGLMSNHNYQDPEESSSMNSDDLDKANYFVSDEYAEIASPLKKDSYADDSYFIKSNLNSGARNQSQENSFRTVTK